MKRYAVITLVEVYSGEEPVGVVEYADGLGFKVKLIDTFMSPEDVAFIGKVLGYLDEHGDLNIEEEIL